MILNLPPNKTTYILSLTMCTFLTADTNVWCRKILFHFMIFFSFSIEIIITPYSTRAPIVPTNFLHTHPKSNLCPANSLPTTVSEVALYRLLTFHVPNLTNIFRCLVRTKVSIQVRGKYSWFVTKSVSTVKICQHFLQTPSWGATLCRLSAIAYSIYSDLSSTLEAVLPYATWGGATRWWKEPTYNSVWSLLYWKVISNFLVRELWYLSVVQVCGSCTSGNLTDWLQILKIVLFNCLTMGLM